MVTIIKQKQVNEDYHIACQCCGTKDQPLHILPLRNEKNVVGLIFSCDGCGKILKGEIFDRESVFRANSAG